MAHETQGHHGVELALRWTARIWSIATIALVLAFIFGERGNLPTLREWPGFLFFPFGICLGMIVAWWKERLGGIMTVASFLAFYVLDFAISGRFPKGWAFLAFAAPGFLFLLSSWARVQPNGPMKTQPQHSH